jgi:predicted nuclease of restriction endonuclease-like (RecB) superfamily
MKTHRSRIGGRDSYDRLVGDLTDLLAGARGTVVRTANVCMLAVYWETGRRIVQFEQSGAERAAYGDRLLTRLAGDLSARHGRGFSRQNLQTMRQFYLQYRGTPFGPGSGGRPSLEQVARRFTLSWSHYAELLEVESPEARAFYEAECVRGDWSVRQLRRQVDSRLYERALLSKNKAAGMSRTPLDGRTPDRIRREMRDPYVLEFLDLKDEYSETDLEDALIRHLETFLLELGSDFTFIGRQRRLRIGRHAYRIDLLLYHRGLRCLVIVDLKLGAFSHEDVGQMNLYLNYAKEHWSRADENPPIGLILCSSRDDVLARYALTGVGNTILAGRYRMQLPDEKRLVRELQRSRDEFLKRLEEKPRRIT